MGLRHFFFSRAADGRGPAAPPAGVGRDCLSAVPEMSGPEKAALLLISIGAAASAEVLKQLNREQITRLTARISTIRSADPRQRAAVIREFERARAAGAGRTAATSVLESVMARESAAARGHDFEDIALLSASELASLAERVGLRTLAAALCGTEPRVKTRVISALDESVRLELLTGMKQAGPLRLRDIEEARELCMRALQDTPGVRQEVAV